jgi:hypothetical protein
MMIKKNVRNNPFRHLFVLLFMFRNQYGVNTPKEERLEQLNMFASINEIANGVKCANAEEWQYTSYGNKACGSANSHIACSVPAVTIGVVCENDQPLLIYP